MGKGKTTLPVPQTKTSDNSLKRSRDDLDTTGDEVESFDDLLVRIQQMFKEGNEKIEAKVETCKCDLQNQISTLRDDVQQYKEECSDEINKLTSSFIRIQDDLHNNIERVCINEKANDLLLSGVPYSPEDLRISVHKIACALGYADNDVPMIHTKRLARAPIAAGATPPIVLQFAFRICRDEFYSRYLSSRNLSLTHIGFNVNKRIYINENLTELARKIKGKAIEQKKTGKLQSVYTKNGIVFVKATTGTTALPIYSLDQLDQ